MGCTVDFSTTTDIAYSCDELSTGGLKNVYLCDKGQLDGFAELSFDTSGIGTVSSATGLETSGVHFVALGFNNKDGFSNFTDVKTLNADGSGSAVPTIQLEFIRMSPALRTKLEAIARPGAELVAFVETAAGTYHVVGYDFGLYAGTVDGASGVARTDKNRFQLTLIGDENVLSYTLDKTNFDKVKA
tara:strand:- start:3400 stop:3960 length:561 start_codon:yes stop_codon:yes gene_type:complete